MGSENRKYFYWYRRSNSPKKYLCHSLVWYTLFIKIVVVKLLILRYEQLFGNSRTGPNKRTLTSEMQFKMVMNLGCCNVFNNSHHVIVMGVCLPISVRKAKSSKRKSPQTFAHLVNFSKNVSAYSHVHNLVILTRINKPFACYVFTACSGYRALFTWSQRTTCAKDYAL